MSIRGIIAIGLLDSPTEIVTLGLRNVDFSSSEAGRKVTISRSGADRVTITPAGAHKVTVSRAGADRVTITQS